MSLFKYIQIYCLSAISLIVILGSCTSCSNSESSSGGAIHYDFYFDKNIFTSEKLPDGLVSICYPKALTECKEKSDISFFAGEESKLIQIGVDAGNAIEQLILEKNAAEKLAGVNVDETYINNKLRTDFKLSEELKAMEPIENTIEDIELFLTDRGISSNQQLYFFSEFSQKDRVRILNKEYPVFQDVNTLKDSIASQLCKEEMMNRVIILYDLAFLSGAGGAVNCDHCDNEEAVVCGDGILYRNRCKAECAGALNISDGPCDEMASTLNIPPLDEQRLKDEAVGFIESFYEYLNEISKGVDLREEVKQLFLDNGLGVTVQLNNKGSSIVRTVSLDSYLDYFYGLKSREQLVTIKASSIKMDEDFSSSMDGDLVMYHNRALIEQKYKRFKRYDEKMGKLLYSDQTDKAVEIVARLAENPGTGKLEWRVYLSSITVEQKAI